MPDDVLEAAAAAGSGSGWTCDDETSCAAEEQPALKYSRREYPTTPAAGRPVRPIQLPRPAPAPARRPEN